MADNWDDSDDEWDVGSDDDELDKRLGLAKIDDSAKQKAPAFDDEEDLAVKEKADRLKSDQAELKTKGKALADKKRAEAERREEEELARKAMELEAEMEENMTEEERRALEKARVEEADHALTDDLFGGVDDHSISKGPSGAPGQAMGAGDKVVLKDLKDHLKHARKVGQCIKGHGKIHLAAAFLKEAIQECKDVLDDDAISDLIKTCNVIKNEKVAQAKRKVKGQAQKAKRDKAAEAKAKKIQNDLFGDSNQYDRYDEVGEQYEDDFF